MRLINADKLKEEFELKEHFHYYETEQYRDYENEWVTRTVEHGKYDPISVVNEAPTVKAIPIEWMKTQIEKCREISKTSKTIGLALLAETIKQWEKENDR